MKIHSTLAPVVGNVVLFQLLWFAAVLGAAAGLAWPAPLALVALLGWAWLCGSNLHADLRLLLIGVIGGVLFELLLLAAGLIRYQLQSWQYLPPVWIICLWAGFAHSFLYSLAWLRQHLALAMLLGAIGSATSMYAGLRFGAAEPLRGMAPLLIFYGAGWSLLTPWLAWQARWRVQPPPVQSTQIQPTEIKP